MRGGLRRRHWDDFDARLTRERSGGVVRGVDLEPLWSHLLELGERLAADGLGAAELAGGAAHAPKVVARARAKVWKQALEDRAGLDLVETPACALHSEYVSARWDFRAREILGLRAYAQVAAGAVDRLTATATVLGSEDWQPLEALVSYALQQGDAATARAVLRAADRPGFHRDRVRRRTIELDRELGREGHV
ncbi:hypothetical protein WJ438_07780 [Streptomyces sp. GD-15H]|uniref:hypothetical protein n=1 Tax=Streptomyces sp. GD-15H TaxID=3129112 RepID=UPI0032537668